MTSMLHRPLLPAALAWITLALLPGCGSMAQSTGLDRIDHIIVIYAENRSFDHLYGLFPGAEGIADATAEQKTQLDHDGAPLPHLPPVYEHGKPDPRFPSALPNGPFRIDAPPINGAYDQVLPSPWHLYYQNREQINGGKNNMYVAMSNVGAWVMGYFDGSKMKLWKWAQEYTLTDHFFMGAYGGSFLNHFWLVCACTPRDPDVASSTKAQLDERGNLRTKPGSPRSVLRGPVEVLDGRATPDGYLVNTSQPPFQPSGTPPAAGGNLDLADSSRGPVPPQTLRTIGDTLWPRVSRGPGTPVVGMRHSPTAGATRRLRATSFTIAVRAARSSCRTTSRSTTSRASHPVSLTARATSRTRRNSSRRSTPVRCRRWHSGSPPAATPSTRATPMS